jgi:hypothetical protein
VARLPYVSGLDPFGECRPVTEPLTDPTDLPVPAFNADVPGATPERPLTPAARRALLEAAERRDRTVVAEAAVEHGGPTGPEPTRYGDWEKKGLAVDF